jgi:hypothetical protein
MSRIRQSVPWAALLALLGCAGSPPLSAGFERTPVALGEDAFLAGETLAQRKHLLERAHRDLKAFHANLASLQRHRHRAETAQLASFLRRYIDGPVSDALSDREEGFNPELTQLDANLLFAEADVLVDLEDRRRLSTLIDDIIERFDGMEGLLVEYPIGEENTLSDALAHLERVRQRIRGEARNG